MPLKIQGEEPLAFQASIDTSAFDAGINKIQDELKQTIESFETLRAKSLAKQSFLIEETDLTKIRGYNKEIEVLEAEMAKIKNAGKSGFDDLGNAITKTAGSTNALSKGFGFIKQAAYLIPGIGIAGIFNLIGEAAVALVTQLFKGGDAINTFAQNWKNVTSVVAKANEDAGKQIADLKILYNAANDVNLSMGDRLKAVKALQTEFPDYFKNISAEAILNGDAKKSYDDLVGSIQAVSRATAAKSKIDDIERQKLDSDFQKQKIINATTAEAARVSGSALNTFALSAGLSQGAGSDVTKAFTASQQQAIIQSRKLKSLADEDKKQQSLDQQEKYLIQFVGEKNITAAVIDENVKRAKRVHEISTQSLDDQRKSLEDQVTKLQNEAADSGLVKDESELKRINDKYDAETKALVAYNERVAAFNQKNNTDVASIGQDEFAKLTIAKSIELANTKSKQEAAIYIQSLNQQKEIFTEYENAKKEIGEQKANQLFSDQTKGFQSYQQYLSSEFLKLLVKVQSGFANVGDFQKFSAVGKAITDAGAKDKEEQIKRFASLLNDTLSFKDKEAKINTKYAGLEKDLNDANAKGLISDYAETSATLQKNKDKELTDLKNNIIRQGDLYKQLSNDIISYSAAAIKVESQKLKDQLRTDTTLTPQEKSDIQGRINQLNDLVHSTDAVSIKTLKVSDEFNAVGSGLSNLSSSLEGVNENLSQTLSLLGQISSGIGGGLKSLDDFKKAKDDGDTAGQIGAGIGIAGAVLSVASTVLNYFKAAKQSKVEAEKEIDDYNLKLQTGQIEYNIELRKTELTQISINKLKAQAILDSETLLAQQKQANQLAYDSLLQQIDAQQYVTGEHEEKSSGNPLFGIAGLLFGKKTKVVQDLGSLAGSSFDDLQKLFDSGQLTEKASALFQELQKLKSEGVDIESQLADAKKQADELFTGTTADSIVDSIADGFSQGFKSVQDFAGKTEDIIRQALLNALKAQALEGPIQKIYAQFAADAQSGGGLDQNEIANLQSSLNETVKNAEQFADQIQKATGISLSAQTDNVNSLQGSIRAQITEETGTVIAGSINGIHMTCIEQLSLANQSLKIYNQIQVNTFNTAENVALTNRLLKSVISGDRIKVD